MKTITLRYRDGDAVEISQQMRVHPTMSASGLCAALELEGLRLFDPYRQCNMQPVQEEPLVHGAVYSISLDKAREDSVTKWLHESRRMSRFGFSVDY